MVAVPAEECLLRTPEGAWSTPRDRTSRPDPEEIRSYSPMTVGCDDDKVSALCFLLCFAELEASTSMERRKRSLPTRWYWSLSNASSM